MDLTKIRKQNVDKRRQKYLNKVNGVKKIFEITELSIEDLFSKYDNTYFANSNISKRDVFEQTMSGTLTDEHIDFLTTMGNVNPHQNDNRQYYEYCIDLILGWIIEDVILDMILKQGIPATLYGVDAGREFLKMEDIDSSPDIKIGTEDNFRLLDVFADWTDFWNKSGGQADLRDFKYKKLESEKALLLGLSPVSQTGFLIDVSTQSYGFTYNPSIWAYGGKSGYTTREINKHMHPIQDVLKNLYKMFQ